MTSLTTLATTAPTDNIQNNNNPCPVDGIDGEIRGERRSNGGDDGGGGGLVFGHMSMMGRRRVMEDAVTVAPPAWLAGEYVFFAVYDGHGGAKVAETCRERLHKYLEEKIMKAREKQREMDWEKVMAECFSSMNDEFEKEAADMMMGSTAVVVLVGKEEMVVANCGDSRAVLCRGGDAIPLSTDHKPDRPDEKERVEAAGGRIVNWNGWRVEGVLNTSRSLEPEVTVVRRTESDNFLIIGTDGLWDVLCNRVACEVVKRFLNCHVSGESGVSVDAALSELAISEGSRDNISTASNAAAALAELAIAMGSKDNISIVVVQLN